MDKNNVRYPFVITDWKGDILFSSPNGIVSGDNIFSEKEFLKKDIRFVRTELAEDARKRLFALERSNGKTAFLSSALYPSTQVFIVLYTDIPYAASIDLLDSTEEKIEVKDGKTVEACAATEKYYPAFMKVVSDIKLMLSSEDSSFFEERIRAFASLAFCRIDKSVPGYISSLPFNFDKSLFSLFLLYSLLYCSEISRERKAEFCISKKDGKPDFKIFVSQQDMCILTEKDRERIDKRFKLLKQHIRAVCDRLNVPYSIILSGDFTARIIPCRIEASLLCLKTPPVFLD
ncbi:MAG: hypothetical protein E7671_03805 [Ruminococcaceae bacterium]|nr:hypothetical protein [Oscillospiraceae bacterium]